MKNAIDRDSVRTVSEIILAGTKLGKESPFDQLIDALEKDIAEGFVGTMASILDDIDDIRDLNNNGSLNEKGFALITLLANKAFLVGYTLALSYKDPRVVETLEKCRKELDTFQNQKAVKEATKRASTAWMN